MAATTKQAAGAGFRHLRVYELNGYGIPLSSSMPANAEDAYDGVQVTIAKALEITIPDPQILNHLGDDRVAATDLLPPTESMTAEARTGHTNLEVDALFQNVLTVVQGEMQTMGRATDQQGLEPNLCLLAYRQAVRTGSVNKGARCWIHAMFPQAQVFPKAGPMVEQAVDENMYTVNPKVASQYPWGIAFAVGTEGYLEAQMIHGISDKRPHIAIWEGDGAETNFLWTAGFIPQDPANKVTVWQWVASTQTSSDVTATISIDTTDLDFTSPGAPASGDIIIAFYEITD